MADKKPKQTFQDRLEALAALVEELERGDISLEDAIARFESGQKLQAQLTTELAGFEQRVEKLVKGPTGEQDGLEVCAPATEPGEGA